MPFGGCGILTNSVGCLYLSPQRPKGYFIFKKLVMTDRKEGFYKVKYKGQWILAKWVTNQDIDSSWSCWQIYRVKPPKGSWGFVDSDFEEINESEIGL
jgi:hypothetical protein